MTFRQEKKTFIQEKEGDVQTGKHEAEVQLVLIKMEAVNL